jgi:hypothetical protein
MTEQTFPPVGGEGPDTDTGDIEVPAAIPVAEAAGGAAQPAPAEAAGPRVFAQHYSILLGSSLVLVGAITVWEREHVFGKEVRGPDMISGAFLLAMAVYTLVVGALNVVGGRLRGMLAAFVTGIASIYLAVGKMIATQGAAHFQGWSDFKGGSFQDKVTGFVGQFGPGVWMSLLGGLWIVLVFVKAIVGGKKKAAAPAPAAASRRRGR